MKLFSYLLLIFTFNLNAANQRLCRYNKCSNNFEENLGQIKYPDNKPAPEVKYVFKQGNLKIFLLKTGLAYQLEKYEQDTNQVTLLPESASAEAGSFSSYRMDMQLLGANPNPEIIA